MGRFCFDSAREMRRQGAGSNARPRPVVVAWYRDGGKEFLDVDTWSRLMGHRSWTSQLIALQGYVHASSNSMGIYTTSDQIDPTRREQKGNPALDTFTKGLAQYCEGAYARGSRSQ